MSLEKEFTELTGLKRDDYDGEQEYVLAILEYVSEEADPENLSEEAQSWFNANVDLYSEGKELLPIDAMEVTEEAFFDDGEEEEVNEEDSAKDSSDEPQSIDIKDVAVDDDILLILTDGKEVYGKVTKIMKVAVKILNEDGDEIRFSHNKIKSVYKSYDEETVEVEDVVEETVTEDVVEDVTIETVTEEQEEDTDNDTEEQTEDTEEKITETLENQQAEKNEITEEVTEETVKSVTLESKHVCSCKSKSNTTKQILYHVSEILRLASESM